ncbi:MAG: IPT/TIG domain-containing protein [Acidobacteriota bacterium]
MQKLLIAATLLFALAPLSAQDHSMHESVHEHPQILTQEQLEQRFIDLVGRPMRPILPASVIAPVEGNAVKTFTITARQFSFTVNPFPFVVNQGDVVTINVTVPSNDLSTVGHGILMEQYFETGFNVARNSTVSKTFTATNAGTFVYVCTQGGCGSGHGSMFGQLTVNAAAPPPTITSVTPSPVSTGGGAVTITGTNFAGPTVQVDGVAATVSSATGTQINASVPPHSAGSATLTVTNGDGQSASRQITYATPAPQINAVSPSTGSTAGGTTLTITGSNFTSGADVTIGGRAASSVTFVNATTMTAVTPLGLITEQATQPQDVVVTLIDGQKATRTGAFTYFVPPLSITGISPPSGVKGTPITITGTGFTSAVALSVTVGGVAATAEVIDPVTIRVTAPTHAAGPVDVKLTLGSTTVTSASAFTYVAVPPRRRAARH